jgi:hypothetical protein
MIVGFIKINIGCEDVYINISNMKSMVTNIVLFNRSSFSLWIVTLVLDKSKANIKLENNQNIEKVKIKKGA